MLHGLRKNKLAGADAAARFLLRQYAGDQVQEPFQPLTQFLRRHWRFDDNGEFIPAKPSHLSILSKNHLQMHRDLFQDLISNRMPKGIIDFLKIIYIHKLKPAGSFSGCATRFLHFIAMIKEHAPSHYTS